MSKLLCHWQVHVLPDRHCCCYFSNTTFHKIGLVTKKPFHVGNALFIPRFAMMMRSILKHSPPVTWRCHSMSGSEALVRYQVTCSRDRGFNRIYSCQFQFRKPTQHVIFRHCTCGSLNSNLGLRKLATTGITLSTTSQSMDFIIWKRGSLYLCKQQMVNRTLGRYNKSQVDRHSPNFVSVEYEKKKCAHLLRCQIKYIINYGEILQQVPFNICIVFLLSHQWEQTWTSFT